ncbi:MAG: amidohydrolase family protein [Bryobacterales bacterium]|nr:amidohydrolase family protein [Bryobacterales bacterium]
MPEVVAIDAHQHLWKYDPVEYGWIQDGMPELRRDFLPPDLKHEMESTGVGGSIAVQARQTLEETEWLLRLAQANDFLRAVVGWVPLLEGNVTKFLERFAVHEKLRGVRHVIQDEPDDDFILRRDFQEGIKRLRTFGLTYDILIYERHLPQTIRFVDQHPHQIFVLDHIAKPRIREKAMSPWKENLRELARRPNVYCKLSGMVTEAEWKGWTPAGVKPYFDVALDTFGPKRLMFGTDWPVLTLAGTYAGWTGLVRQWIGGLGREEQKRILRGTAIEAYGL